MEHNFPYKAVTYRMSGNIYNFKVFKLSEESLENIPNSAGIYILTDESEFSKRQHFFLLINKTDNLQKIAKEFLNARNNIIYSGQLNLFTCEAKNEEELQVILRDILALYKNHLPSSIFFQ